MNKTKILDCIEICRPKVALQAATSTFLGAYLSGGLIYLGSKSVILSALLVTLAVAFAFVINDYRDVDVDKINKPNHAIPAGRVTKKDALLILVILSIFEIVIGIIMGPVFIMIGAGLLLLSTAYSVILKGTPLIGNFTVAILNSSIILIGASAANGINLSVLLATMAGWLFTVAQEVLYTARDVDADKVIGLQTTAVAFGFENTIRIYKLALLIFMVSAILPWYLKSTSIYYLFTIILISIAPLASNLNLGTNSSIDRINQACNISKLARVTTIIAMILLR